MKNKLMVRPTLEIGEKMLDSSRTIERIQRIIVSELSKITNRTFILTRYFRYGDDKL